MGPPEDTPLEWFQLGHKIGFRAVLGGYPRQIVGNSRAELEKVAKLMRGGKR